MESKSDHVIENAVAEAIIDHHSPSANQVSRDSKCVYRLEAANEALEAQGEKTFFYGSLRSPGTTAVKKDR